ncbi:MAG: peroxidase [Pseudomonadota bacterium]
MSFITTHAPSNASAEVLAMYARQQEHWGYIPEYAKLFSHRPEALTRWGRLLAELRRYSDERRFELVTFVVALELRNSSCALAHGKKLAGLIGKHRVLAIASRNEHSVMCLTDQAVIRFARAIARDATTVSAHEVDTLLAEYGISDAEVFDIAAIAAARCFFVKLLDALGCQPDSTFSSIDEELRRVLTVGKPISLKAPERLDDADSVDRGSDGGDPL